MATEVLVAFGASNRASVQDIISRLATQGERSGLLQGVRRLFGGPTSATDLRSRNAREIAFEVSSQLGISLDEATPSSTLTPSQHPHPQLVLKLSGMGRDRTHRDEITFNWTEGDSVFHRVFGFALENTTESTPAKGMLIRMGFWWQGDPPQKAPIIHAPRRLPGWTPPSVQLFAEHEAMLSFRDPELVCVHQHPEEWGNFKVEFSEPVKGSLLITYTVSTLEPVTENQGELRIIIEDDTQGS